MVVKMESALRAQIAAKVPRETKEHWAKVLEGSKLMGEMPKRS